jgi:nicotinamidase-related amidase
MAEIWIVPLTQGSPFMATALLIIDVQRALCSGEWAAFDIKRVMERINGLIARARAVSTPIVFVQHEEDEGPFQFGAGDWQLADELAVSPDDPRVRKRTPDSFYQTELQDLLQEQGITHLIICGLQSDYCVDATVRRALTLDYHVTLVSDAHSTLDNDVLTAEQITAHHNLTFKNMSSFGPRIRVIPAGDVQMKA